MEDRPSNPSAFRYVSRLADGRTPIPVDSVLLEFRVNLKTGTPISSSYRNLFRVEVFEFDHPIKQIAFSGMFLYIAHGDGSSPTDVSGTGMENDALGKILRINPLKSKNSPYTIPKSNPFLGSNRFPDETWAVGFRNPHHLCFSRNGTLFSAESGHDNVEEINIILPGKNYGWANREGTFVHLDRGGVLNGIKPLPMQDAKNKFEYPVIQLGHEGDRGEIDSGEAIAGACPVENSSPMGGKYFYADFPRTGNLYFSNLDEIFAATTRGDPKRLKQARTRQAVIFFDHDNNENTPPLKLNSLGDVLRSDPDFRNQDRVDVRFGRTSNGYLYWSSKRNGRIYLFTSSVPGGPGGVP